MRIENSLFAGFAALLAGAVAACYDWERPTTAPPAEQDPQGDSGTGAAPPSSSGAGLEEDDTDAASSAEASTAASSSASSSSAASGGATSGDPPNVCDGGGNCDDCIACAVDGPCAAEAEACEQDLGCLAFLDCVSGCGDEACALDCADGNEEGAEIFQQAAACVVCDTCSLDGADLADVVGCL